MRSSARLASLATFVLLAVACADEEGGFTPSDAQQSGSDTNNQDGGQLEQDSLTNPDTGPVLDAITDSAEGGGAGADGLPGEDSSGGSDAVGGGDSRAETDVGNTDVAIEEPDSTPPGVQGAFSADGETITVRFSEDMDADSTSVVKNFTILASDNSQLGIGTATADGVFAKLELAPGAAINPALTYTVRVKNVFDLAGNGIDPKKDSAVIKRSVYLAILWHQHQPLYLDVLKDQLMSPWVRNHATKSYYDMASTLEGHPDVHVTINLTVVLLKQLEVYLERLEDFVDVDTNTVDEAAFFAAWEGRTDPWIDLLLRDTPTPSSATEREIELLYDAPWSCVSVSDTVMQRFPEYVELRDKNPKLLTQQDFLKLKLFFVLAWMDPDFLKGPVTMPNGMTVDLSDVVEIDPNDDIFYLAVPPSEALANRLVAESYKIMANVVPIHKKLAYDSQTHTGQIEVTTTPFYHPILPLIYDTEEARQGQPFDSLPSPPYSDPENAFAQVAKAKGYFESLFDRPPLGMWPGEGSVSESVVSLFADNGVQWIATGHKVLEKSTPPNQPAFYPYRVDADSVNGPGGSIDDEVAILFRDTELSDKIGFKFQSYTGIDAANEFVGDVLAKAPAFGGKDRLVVVILDGENAWENYRFEYDGKGFFSALYGKLQEASQVGDIITVTPSEYIQGNPTRGLPAHPVSTFPELEPLFAGSWIDGTFSIWVGESEENQAWGCLRQARQDLQLSKLPRPNPLAPQPPASSGYAYYVWKAWEELYASEGSDWFWWYGADMTTPANDDTPFDQGFRAHIAGMYEFMNKALTAQGKSPIPVFTCPPIIQADPKPLTGPFTSPPTLDGAFLPNEAEWSDGGAFFFDDDSGGAIKNPDDDIGIVYYGYDADAFYLAISANESLADKLGSNYAIAVYASHKHIINIGTGETEFDPANTESPEGLALEFGTGGAAREIRVNLASGQAKTTLSAADGFGNWLPTATNDIEMGGPVSGGSILELRIPWADLNLQLGDPLEIRLAAIQSGIVVDSAPNLGSRVVFQDETNAIFVTFQVDVSGSVVPIDQYVDITTPPPPSGKGIVFITGNQDALSNWTPNKIALVDDGVAPDSVANDKKWTATFKFPPGTLLRWKYTIGLNTDEGKWYGTEEFPLTERGYEIPLDPSIKKVMIQDIFADRPMPTGTPGPKTVVQELTE